MANFKRISIFAYYFNAKKAKKTFSIQKLKNQRGFNLLRMIQVAFGYRRKDTICVWRFLFFSFFLMHVDYPVHETLCTIHALFTHCSWDPQPLYLEKKYILKMSLTILFTYLKFILLQCFQFSVFSKINSIQKDSVTLTLQNMNFMIQHNS